MDVYRDDDRGYARWLALWLSGYVLNIAATLNPADARVHTANCSSIRPQDGESVTRAYIKVCAPLLAELQQWSADQAMPLPPPWRDCLAPDLLMKPIFDEVIAAFQVHTDSEVLGDVSDRLATTLTVADPAEIERHLRDEGRAVPGPVDQLVLPHGSAGIGNPDDHLCIAGQLLAAEPVDGRWAICGRVVEMRRIH
ncbi:hypothetical protein BayCH28_24740 [Mycolicibacterium sp. CH28]|uniref:hypothetical protein n=1 Tax=Mycolicibacterium sp. CH28 TaxID=2512237 RepID=UPI001081904C|nr:hypothetical protein [Mycolicibacterium sp. CH28]TGD84612.1 hypothetical protein BayCH28_24740 [Mycolicibacterium sp. CH28]